MGLSIKAKCPQRSESRLSLKGLSMVRLSIPADTNKSGQLNGLIVKIIFELLVCKKVDISS